MNRILLFFGACLLVLSSCVPNKKILYFQNNDLKKPKQIPKDTVLRTHNLQIQEYRIQPLDVLSVNFETISDEADQFDFLSKISPQTRSNNVGNALLSGIMVDTEGNIEYSVLGKIRVAGLTIFEAQDSIRYVASRYLPDVIVRVRMLNFRFTVLGEVDDEQVVTSNNPRLTMAEAIGLAGGFGELADRSNVKVIRQRGVSTDVYYINLLKEDFIESPHYFVQQNDVIVVPPLKQRPFRRYFTSNLAIIASTLSFALLVLTFTR